MLDSETPNAWEQLHDVGAAHLVFVVPRQVLRATSQMFISWVHKSPGL